MADDENEAENEDVAATPDEENDDGEAEDGEKKINKKKLFIILAAAALLLGASGVAAFFFFSGGGEKKDKKEEEKVEQIPFEYVTLDTITVDLLGNSRRTNYIKLQIIVEIASPYKNRLEEKMPVILDAMKSYLRDKSKKDLAGSEGTEELRGDLFLIIDNIMKPMKIKSILFKDIIVQ